MKKLLLFSCVAMMSACGAKMTPEEQARRDSIDRADIVWARQQVDSVMRHRSVSKPSEEEVSENVRLDVWYAMKERVKSMLKDPSSFEEDGYSVKHYDGDVYVVTMRFYGTNSFGARMINNAQAKARWSKESTSIFDLTVE